MTSRFLLPLLVSFMLWGRAHTLGCSKFPKSNIILSEVDLKDPTAVGTYINNRDDPRLMLSCYKTRDDKGSEYPVAVISNAQGEHVVTIKDFHCDNKKNFNQKTYVTHSTNNNEKTLTVGILPKTETSGVWCQYNVCYTCKSAMTMLAVKQVKTVDSSLKVFRWSEKGIQLHPTRVYKFEEERKIKKEFLSVGDETFVLTCYENGMINIRTSAGLTIVSIPDLKCYPDEYIQTFYVLNIKKVGNWRYKFTTKYQLGKKMDTSWKYGEYPPSETEDTFYYFSTSEKSQPYMKMCYWNPVNLEKPNTCPSIRDDNIEFDPRFYEEMIAQFEHDIIAVYKKDVGLKLTVLEVMMRNDEDGRSPGRKATLVVVTNRYGAHILTLKLHHYWLMGHFSRNYFIHTMFDNEQTKYIVFGSRLDQEDDWCTYSLFKGESRTDKWIYYDYKPQPHVFSWELIDGAKTGLRHYETQNRDKDMRLDYPEPLEKDLIGKYLWIGMEKQTSLILLCYESKDGYSFVESNVIKNTNGDTVVSIVGVACLKSSSKDMEYQLKVVNIEHNKYLIIIKKNELLRHRICLDCMEKEIEETYKKFPKITAITWTVAGIQWKHLSDTSNRERVYQISKQWHTSGKIKFAIGSEMLSSGRLRYSLRTTNGVVIGTLSVESDSDVLRISYYIYTKSGKESKVYTSEDCQTECDILPNDDKEVWFFYNFKKTGNGDFVPTDSTCRGFKNVDFYQQEEEHLKDNTPTQSYWNGGNPKLTLGCYLDHTKTFAVIINELGKHLLTLKGFACSGSETDQQIYDAKVASLYIDMDRYDTNRIVVGIIDHTSSCYYSFPTDGKDSGNWFYVDYEPNTAASQWYKPGACADIPKENILTNQENGGDTNDLGVPTKRYVSLTHGNHKTLYCYQQDQVSSNTVVVKSLSGDQTFTVKGLDCSDVDTFSLSYFKSREKTYLTFWKSSESNKDIGCRYDICMNCQNSEILLNINKARINSGIFEWIHVPEEQPGHKDVLDSVTETTVLINKNMKMKKEDYELVLKFVTEDENNKINLNCYHKIKSSHELPDYFSEFTDASGQYLFHILNHDCTKDKDHQPFTIAYDKTAKDEVFFLSIHNDKYGLCQKCESPFKVKISNFNNVPNLEQYIWKKENLDKCLKISRDDISVEENKFQFDGSYQITKYIGHIAVGHFELICHSKHDSQDKPISVLRDISNGKHLISMRGIDCSSTETINKEIFISVKKEEDKVYVYLGTRPEFGQSRCQFEVCTSSKGCDPEIKINYDLIHSNNWLKWSRNGIMIDLNSCPSPEIETPCVQAGTCDLVAEYEQKNFNKIYTLACFKSKTESAYYLTLRTTKGFYIQTVTGSENCDSFTKIITQFYMVKHSKSKTILYDMNEINIEEVIESCWGKKDNDEDVEITFFYFVGDDLDQTNWMTSSHLTQECPGLPKQNLEGLSEEGRQSLDGELIAEYSNAGQFMAKLSCYKSRTGDSYFAIITNTNDGRMLKITGFSCVDQNKLDYLYVDTGIVTIIGSRSVSDTSDTPDWCFYSVYTNGDKTQTRHLTSYTRKPVAGVWLKNNFENCPAIKGENVIFDESLKSTLNGKKPILLFMIAFDFNKYFNGITKTNVMRYYCYTMNNAEDSEKFVMIVKDAEGKHVLTVKDFDCSRTLKNRFFAFSMTESSHPPFLALGSRSSDTDDWCVYGFCSYCEPKQLRLGASKYIANGYEVLVWNEGKSDDCPAVKRENLFEKIDENNLNTLTEDFVYVLSVFNYKYESSYIFDIKETLIIYCYYKEDGHGKRRYTMVVRSTERRHLVTVNDYDCSQDKQAHLQENTYAYTYEEKSEHLLLLGTRNSGTDDWCQYQICLTCPRSKIRRQIHTHEDNTDSSSSISLIFKWMPVIQVMGSLTREVEPKKPIAPDDGSKLIVKYENGKFGLECYLLLDQGNVKTIAIFLNQHGKRVAKVFEPNCLVEEAVKTTIKVINSKPNTAEQDDGLLVGVISNELTLCCTYKSCLNCEEGQLILDVKTDGDVSAFKEKINNYDAKLDSNNVWLKVDLNSCYEFPESNIFTYDAVSKLVSNTELTESYINENAVDEDTIVMFCHGNSQSNGGIIWTRLKSLGKKQKGFDISIQNLDCKSLLSNVYMEIETHENGDRYLMLGVRTLIKVDNTVTNVDSFPWPWCRFDICIDCKDRLVKVSDKFDPSKLTPVKWSKAGIKTPSREEVLRNAGVFDTGEIPFIRKFAHFEYHDFNIDCRELPPNRGGNGESFSVIRFRVLPLVVIPGRGCLARGFDIQNFYIYTYDKSDTEKHYVTRLGPSFNTREFARFVSLEASVPEHWFYYFSRTESTEEHDWVEVQEVWDVRQGSMDDLSKKFKLTDFTRKNFEAHEEEKKCFTRDKELRDFEPMPILDRRETQTKNKNNS